MNEKHHEYRDRKHIQFRKDGSEEFFDIAGHPSFDKASSHRWKKQHTHFLQGSSPHGNHPRKRVKKYFMEEHDHPSRPFHGSHRVIRKKLLGRGAFFEMQELIVLGFIQEEEAGISGYELQQKLDIPRGNLLRIIDRLEKQEYLLASETTDTGRLKKLYQITDKGKTYLSELRIKWANRGELIDDMAPYEHFGGGRPLHHHHGTKRHKVHFKDITDAPLPPHAMESRDNSQDYLRGRRNRLNAHYSRLQHRMEAIKAKRDTLNQVIDEVDQMPEFTPEAFEDILEKYRKSPEVKKKDVDQSSEEK